MSDFKPTPETDLTTTQLLDRYNINDTSLLRTWATLHGLNGSRSTYSPQEIDLLDHVHHHLHNLGMTIDEYQNLLNRRPSRPTSEPPQPVNNSYTPPNSSAETTPKSDDEIVDGAAATVDLLMAQYSEAIECVGERIAEHFIDELDASVMRHLAKKVQERQAMKSSQPNRFLRTIKSVLKPSHNPMLTDGKSEQSPWEMESNHRLG
ncbi:MAG: hypothetical protein KFF72_03775 [Arthrospira sp. SH-MAG29]|nr:hypothetical protein [Arthrospira sp. SH-MAG29]MBS0015476.1 hypothetical protein [Arthrospira sp. SH-MAG29]